MASMGVLVSQNNSSFEPEFYIFHSTIEMLELISRKITLVAYSIVLTVSIIQTFWKNKRIDQLFSYMIESYSDRKFESNQVCFDQQRMRCYRSDQRFSFIRNPNRIILLIIAIHIQVLMLIMIKTLFIRRSELVNDCFSFHFPSKVLLCEDNRNPCQSNHTESLPKCFYYYFEMSNIITMVTSLITWHYALRYLVVKLVRFIRWVMFRDDDQPRMLCSCCCRPTRRRIRCIMCFQYIILWLYFFSIILLGFIWNLDVTRISDDILGSGWEPIIIATDRLCSLTTAVAPELLQNWLDVSGKREDPNGFDLANVEPLIHLTNKKIKLPALSKNNTEGVAESNTHM